MKSQKTEKRPQAEAEQDFELESILADIDSEGATPEQRKWMLMGVRLLAGRVHQTVLAEINRRAKEVTAIAADLSGKRRYRRKT